MSLRDILDQAILEVDAHERHVREFEPGGKWAFFEGHQRTNLIGKQPRSSYLLAGLDLLARHGSATVSPADLADMSINDLAANVVVMLEVLTGILTTAQSVSKE